MQAVPGTHATSASVVDLAAHTRRQIAGRLLPFVFALYVTNYIDRTNLAYAALGMTRDLGFSDRVFGMGAGIFFAGYVALQIPGALLVELWSARRCISAIMIVWGSLTALTALVQNAPQLYLARFVLGAAEAGFFPGVVVYLSHWFIREDRAKAGSNFMAAIPISFVIGSPLAGWILSHHWLGTVGWRWLFMLEGLPAILLGIAAFFYLTDWPAEATWLAPDPRAWIIRTLEEEKAVKLERGSIWRTLASRDVLLLSLAAFFAYFVSYSTYFWFPTVLKRLSGFSDARVGWLGAIPYLAGFFAMQMNGWHSDRMAERRWHAATPLFVAALALLGLMTLPTTVPLAMTLFTLVVCSVAFLPVFWAIPTEVLSESAAATAVGLVNAVGSVAGFAGPFAFGYLNTRTGSYWSGLAAMMICAVVSGLLILLIGRGAKPRGMEPVVR